METVSSSLTFFYKFVFTAVWSAVVAVATVGMFLSDTPEARDTRWQFAAMWLVGSAFIWWICGRLKRVELDGSTLVVSNYVDEIRVPVTQIASVRQNRLSKPRSVTVVFKAPTRFGQAITFMPQVSFRVFSEDEIVGRLRSMARSEPAVAAGGASRRR